ncbi:MAG: hydrogenase maturation protease [Thiotrichaceae bacterium]|nr:hydrogenase maturation protease [Thiotrichaceae bacterium]
MKYIIGMGNIMRSDDGIGPHMIDYILENKLENNFHAMDFGTNAWSILPLLKQNTEKILIIDCTRMQQNAGHYQFFKPDSVCHRNNNSVESHESSIVQLINTAANNDYIIPDITFMGIEPENTAFGQQLSIELSSRLENYIQESIQFILS